MRERLKWTNNHRPRIIPTNLTTTNIPDSAPCLTPGRTAPSSLRRLREGVAPDKCGPLSDDASHIRSAVHVQDSRGVGWV